MKTLPAPTMAASGAVNPQPVYASPDDDAGPNAPGSMDAGTETASADEDDAGMRCEDCCSDGFVRGAAGKSARRLTALKPSGDGVAVCPNGEIFVATDGNAEISRVTLSGERESWAKLGDRRPAGLACDEENRLYVATFASQSGAAIEINIVLIAAKDAAPVALPQPKKGPKLQGLNGIVAVPNVGVYATDTLNSAIVLAQETAPGTFSVRTVAQDVTLANGLAYSADARKLYAVASGTAELSSFDVAEDGSLSHKTAVPVNAVVLFMDGVAVDERRQVYIADYLAGAIIRVSDGAVIARATNPASLVFRGGTLLFTDYRVGAPDQEGGLYAIELGVCGAPVTARSR